jgi:signal transduction histidine kinase
MRRKDVVYGWFSLMAGVWWWQVLLQGYTTSPWPFADTYAWHRGVITLFLLHNALFLVFMLRFCDQRWRRLERALWLAVAAGAALMAWVPVAQIAGVQQLISWFVCFTFFGACFVLLRHTWYSRRTDHRILSLVMSVSIAAAVHDILLLAGWLSSDIHYTVYTSQLEMLGMALVLAWRFAASLGRIERFSDELAAKVTAAREELALTLQRQHALEVANARLTERNSLAHDLHDGLGGTLVSSIAAMEHAEGGVPAERFLGILKELRDELRITVDIGASQQLGDHALGELIAPPRHRLTRLCEGQRIACHWHIDDAAAQRPVRAAQGLDLVRALQEAVTNVLKHSGANRVDIDMRQDAAQLVLTVTDNGVGFDASVEQAHFGTGLHSLRLRAQRLGGQLMLASRPGQTVVALSMPWPASAPEL